MDSGARRRIRCWVLSVIAAAACGGPAMAICDDIPLLAHHDGSFEWGYTWYCQGYPDGGSFAEGFTGPGIVCGIQAYLCEMNMSSPDVAVFVWDSDGGRPGAVLASLHNLVAYLPYCPDLVAWEIEITAEVGEEFFVGIFPCSWAWELYLGADLDGPGSGDQSWTHVPPGAQWPEGWQRVNDIWDQNVHALGIGVYLDEVPTSVEAATWGRIKALYHE